jgi:hypothetical protein
LELLRLAGDPARRQSQRRIGCQGFGTGDREPGHQGDRQLGPKSRVASHSSGGRLPCDDVSAARNADTLPDDHEIIHSRIARVTLERATIRIALSDDTHQEAEAKALTIPWTPPSPYRRREIIQGTSVGSSSIRPLPTSARLVITEALRKAHRWLDELLSGPTHTIESIAARENKSERSIRMTLSLAFLSPNLVKAAIEGRLPRGFGLTRLIDLPMAWSDQWAALGSKSAGTHLIAQRYSPGPSPNDAEIVGQEWVLFRKTFVAPSHTNSIAGNGILHPETFGRNRRK